MMVPGDCVAVQLQYPEFELEVSVQRVARN